jgi:hypothetical protein
MKGQEWWMFLKAIVARWQAWWPNQDRIVSHCL